MHIMKLNAHSLHYIDNEQLCTSLLWLCIGSNICSSDCHWNIHGMWTY